MTEQNIFELLHTIEKVTYQMVVQWQQRSDNDLGISHILVLQELLNEGESRPSDIAKKLNFTPASLTHLSTKLTKQGLVVRRQAENDKRTKYLSITDEGKSIVEKAYNDGIEVRRELFSHISADEQQALLDIYKKLDDALKEAKE
ncbi:MarR family winged helix-turn-helix transcriptional regulator [Sporosarcina trichiuri]|uniref:MarR family winged helix-turn-helix transcriptional regulator n=1 Tax=Sporosarcina trichiuri TaxID=3056445 RepID=UPI0025B5BF6A|nr:MarR family transcriptional regulator [Sporosarcina sp. 0.2-SM1T-5]WJY28218.1 MarR family transcriptional regulator [Sporosarcina sp. 0.2-SM1T-5]